MFVKSKLALLMVAAFLPACGGGGSPTVTGLKVKMYPSDGVAYVGQASPWNGVAFTAYLYYSDGSSGTASVAGVQWTGDSQAYWVHVQGNVATCLQASASRAIVTGTATVNGAALSGTQGMWCM